MLPASNDSSRLNLTQDLSQKSLFKDCYEACLKGKLEKVNLLLNTDSTLLSQCDEEGQTLLYACVVSNELEILQWLHEKNILAFKQVRNDGKTLMHIAAIKGHFELMKWLHSKDASLIDQVDKHHFTPLHEAAFNEHIPICKLFVEEIKANEQLIQQIAQKKCPKTLALILECGVKADILNSSEQTLLHLAAEAGQEENVRCLLQQGASINAQDQSKRTPLFLAVIQNRLSTVELLLQNEADTSLVDIANETILHAAVFYNHQQLLKELLTYHFCKNLVYAKDQDGETPLHKAVREEAKPEIVKLLLANRADANSQNYDAYTPLHLVAMHGHTKSAELLLDHGAKLSVNTHEDLPCDHSLV